MTNNAPSRRQAANAVWTGTEMLVDNGDAGVLGNVSSPGGRYAPQTNTWKTLPPQPEAKARSGAIGVWTGRGFLVWGGSDYSNPNKDGAVFHPNTPPGSVPRIATVLPAGSNAVYSAPLGAPACTGYLNGCDATTLVTGRATLGPEANAPNTLVTSACADGTAGIFHSDESLDRLAVATPDGGPIAPGRPLYVTADVWAYGGFTSDFLDLFTSPSVAAPVWRWAGTVSPTAAGANTLSAEIVLPAGDTVQAIRGQLRFNGYGPDPCNSGTYDDRDDLVLPVVTGPQNGTFILVTGSVILKAGRPQRVQSLYQRRLYGSRGQPDPVPLASRKRHLHRRRKAGRHLGGQRSPAGPIQFGASWPFPHRLGGSGQPGRHVLHVCPTHCC